MHLDDTVLRHHKTNGIRCTAFNQGIDVFFCHRERVPQLLTRLRIVNECLFLRLCLGPQLVEFLCRVKCVICMPFSYKLIAILLIKMLPITLFIRTIRTSDNIALVKFYPAPVKRLDDILLCTRNKSCLVSVLNSQQHLPAVLLGKQIII